MKEVVIRTESSKVKSVGSSRPQSASIYSGVERNSLGNEAAKVRVSSKDSGGRTGCRGEVFVAAAVGEEDRRRERREVGGRIHIKQGSTSSRVKNGGFSGS
jgi:hypothetical protein